MAKSLSIAGRLESLNLALKRARDMDDDIRLEAEPMRQLIGVSWPSLRSWCDEISLFFEDKNNDCFVRGGQGVSWQFNPVRTIEVLIEHFEQEMKSRNTRSEKIQKSVGVSSGAGDDIIEVSDLSKMIDMTLKLHAAKTQAGEFIPVEEVRDFIKSYNNNFVQLIMSVTTKIDSTGSLSPEVIDLMNEYLRSIAVSCSEESETYLKELDANIKQARNDGDNK